MNAYRITIITIRPPRISRVALYAGLQQPRCFVTLGLKIARIEARRFTEASLKMSRQCITKSQKISRVGSCFVCGKCLLVFGDVERDLFVTQGLNDFDEL